MSGIQMQLAAATSGGSTYAYVALGTANTNNVYGGATVSGVTLLPTQPPSVPTNATALVADGSFIALTGGYYSTNSGGSWSQWVTNVGQYTSSSMPPGLNGSAGYNPTAKRFFTFRTDYDPKTNSFLVYGQSVTSTGSATQASSTNVGGTAITGNVTYSPALNTFYVNNCASSSQTSMYYNGTTGTRTGTLGVPAPGNYKASISSDGYPLLPAYAGYGSVFRLRKYTSADLSTYTDFGTISDGYNGYAIRSPWVWLPLNGIYIIAAGQTSSSTVILQYSTSGSPQSLNYLSSVSVSTYGSTSINFMEQSNGTIWMFGRATNYSKGPVNIIFTQFSTNGGVTWSTPGGYPKIAISKNFT